MAEFKTILKIEDIKKLNAIIDFKNILKKDYGERMEVIAKAIIDNANEKNFESLYRSNLIKSCEILLDEIRERVTGMKIKFLLVDAPEASSKAGIVDIYMEESLYDFTTDEPSFKNFVSAAGTDLSIQVKKIEESEKNEQDLIDLLIIRDRVKKIEKYYMTSSDKYEFETYYARKGSPLKNDFTQMYEQDNEKTKIDFINRHLKNKNEINHKNDILEKQYENFSKMKEISLRYALWLGNTPKTETENGIYFWYAYTKFGIKKIFKINRGQYSEALLHAASSLTIGQDGLRKEYDFYSNPINAEKEYEGYNINQNTVKLNIDEAIIKGLGNLELFRGGDVNFLLYKKIDDNKLELDIKTYQVKANKATSSMNTIYGGFLLLYDFIFNKTYTQSIKLYNGDAKEWLSMPNEKNQIKNVRKLEDILWEDFTIDIDDPKLQKEIDKILEKKKQNFVTGFLKSLKK